LAPGRDKVTMKQPFPLIVRAGARYIHERFDVEVDFVWENYSSLQGFELEMDAAIDDGSYGTIEMPDSIVPKNYRDTYSVRLGGDINVLPKHLVVRLGGFFQSSAYPENNETFSVDFPFGTQFGLGAGLTWITSKWLDVNLGYMHIFQPTVEVDRGIVQQQGLPATVDGEEVAIGNIVNSGRYDVNLNIFSLSLEGHF